VLFSRSQSASISSKESDSATARLLPATCRQHEGAHLAVVGVARDAKFRGQHLRFTVIFAGARQLVVEPLVLWATMDGG